MFSKAARWRRPQPSALAAPAQPGPTLLAARSAAQAETVGQGALAHVILGHFDGRKVARKVVHVHNFPCNLAPSNWPKVTLKESGALEGVRSSQTRGRASKHCASDRD
ncbi:unnamed protein product [Effrenium voratum]|nr:unnamed protein product [Effrenium voratum]